MAVGMVGSIISNQPDPPAAGAPQGDTPAVRTTEVDACPSKKALVTSLTG